MSGKAVEQIRCADAIVDALLDRGVDTIFGLPGAQTYGLFDALHAKQDRIKVYCSRHEQGAAYMASGYAKSTGKVGVYTVVPGPGLLNTGGALLSSHNAPVLCITGEIPRSFIGLGHGMLHEMRDQLGTLRTFTKWAERIEHPSQTASVMSEAFVRLTTGRIQPVAVEVPADVLDMRAPMSPAVAPSAPWKAEPDPACIKAAASALRAAKRPMIMVGTGAIDAADEVLELAELIQAPVVSFRGGRGIVSDDSPYGFTCAAGYEMWKETDLLVGIGARLELPAFRWQNGRPFQKLIRIDVDPRQTVRLRADVPIVADAKLATRALVIELQRTMTKRASRLERFADVKAATLHEIQSVQPQMSYLNVIRDVLPRDGFLVDEVSQVGFTSWFGFPVYQPRRLVGSGYQGNLGYGFQAALGVKIANPTTAVVSIVGDGGFMFGVQELATAVEYQIPLVVVLFNNQAFGNVRRDQIEHYGGRIYGADLRNPDFIKLAESFGVKAYRAKSPAELRTRLEAAFGESGPVLIEVPCERGSETSPWKFLMPTGYGAQQQAE